MEWYKPGKNDEYTMHKQSHFQITILLKYKVGRVEEQLSSHVYFIRRIYLYFLISFIYIMLLIS